MNTNANRVLEQSEEYFQGVLDRGKASLVDSLPVELQHLSAHYAELVRLLPVRISSLNHENMQYINS